MRQTIAAAILAGGLAVASACPVLGQSPDPDAKGIVQRAIGSVLAAGSVHFHVVLEALATPSASASIGSASADGDMSIDTGEARVTFDLPLLGGAGEMRIASDRFIYTRLAADPTGLWHRTSSQGQVEDPQATAPPAALDFEAMATTALTGLDSSGVEASLGAPAACPAAAAAGVDATCDTVELVVPASILQGPSEFPEASPGPASPDIALTLLVDRATSLPDTLRVTTEIPGLGITIATIALTDYGIAVDVPPPPAAETTDDPFPLDIFLPASPAP